MTTFLGLPAVLAPYAQQLRWVLWKREVKRGKPTKPPYQARDPRKHATSNDPATWASFDTTLTAYRAGQADGIGFCLLNSELAAFDIDDCRDAVSGKIEPAARRLIERANSYVEITPSGCGLRILLIGTGAKVHRKQTVPGANGMSIETYRRAERFIAVTGNALPEAASELADGDALIDESSPSSTLQRAKTKTKSGATPATPQARPRRHHPQRRARSFQRRPIAGRLVCHQRNASPRRRAR